MTNITCQELLDLRENYQFEVKSAQGQNDKGEVPKDVWESYSAILNHTVKMIDKITYNIRTINLQHLSSELTTFEKSWC